MCIWNILSNSRKFFIRRCISIWKKRTRGLLVSLGCNCCWCSCTPGYTDCPTYINVAAITAYSWPTYSTTEIMMMPFLTTPTGEKGTRKSNQNTWGCKENPLVAHMYVWIKDDPGHYIGVYTCFFVINSFQQIGPKKPLGQAAVETASQAVTADCCDSIHKA